MRHINSPQQKHEDSSHDVGGKSSVERSLNLQCPPCDRIHCSPRKPRQLRCKGGVTRGICNCCPVCARIEGEPCGGVWDYLGKCDRGLQCEADAGQPARRDGSPEGRCRKVDGYQADEAFPYYCEPKCTAEFCKKHPRALCSAHDVAEKSQDCQGVCQHTSCQACRFIQKSPSCEKCRQDDFPCIRRYARCIRKDYCNRDKFPCRKKWVEEEGSTFSCQVPECLLP